MESSSVQIIKALSYVVTVAYSANDSLLCFRGLFTLDKLLYLIYLESFHKKNESAWQQVNLDRSLLINEPESKVYEYHRYQY